MRPHPYQSCLLLYYVFSPKWLHVEVRGLAVTTFVFDQRFSVAGKPLVLSDGKDFPPGPPSFLPSTTSRWLVTACWEMLASSRAVSSQVRVDLRIIKTWLRGKLNRENVDDQLSHHHTTLRCDGLRDEGPFGGPAEMIFFCLKALWAGR